MKKMSDIPVPGVRSGNPVPLFPLLINVLSAIGCLTVNSSLIAVLSLQ